MNKYKNISTLISAVIVIYGLFYSNAVLAIIIVALSIALINAPEYILPPLLISTFLNENVFVFGGITASRYFTVLFIMVAIFQFFTQKKKCSAYLFLYILLLSTYISISALCSHEGFTNAYATMILNLCLVFSTSTIQTDKQEDVLAVIEYGAGVLLLAMCVVFFRGTLVFDNGAYELIGGANNNLVGMLLAQIGSVFIANFIIKSDSRLNKKIVRICFVSISFFLLFLSGSRSATFGLILVALIGLFYNSYEKGNRLKMTIVYSLLIIGAWISINYVLESNPILANRFTISSIVETGGTGRFPMWECIMNNIIKEKPIFGVGFGSENIAYILHQNGMYHSGTHNILLDILAQIGIIGLLFLLVGFVRIVKNLMQKVKQNCKEALIPLMMIIAAIGNGLGENIFTERFLWVSISMGVLIIFNQNRKEKSVDTI